MLTTEGKKTDQKIPKNYSRWFTSTSRWVQKNILEMNFQAFSADDFCIQILRIISHISSSYLCLLLSLVCFKFCSRCSLLLVCFCCLPLHSSSDICSTVSWRHNCPITAEPKVQCQCMTLCWFDETAHDPMLDVVVRALVSALWVWGWSIAQLRFLGY